MVDYDGTLTPVVKDPQSAIPSDYILRTLKSLAADPQNAVSRKRSIFLGSSVWRPVAGPAFPDPPRLSPRELWI